MKKWVIYENQIESNLIDYLGSDLLLEDGWQFHLIFLLPSSMSPLHSAKTERKYHSKYLWVYTAIPFNYFPFCLIFEIQVWAIPGKIIEFPNLQTYLKPPIPDLPLAIPKWASQTLLLLIKKHIRLTINIIPLMRYRLSWISI